MTCWSVQPTRLSPSSCTRNARMHDWRRLDLLMSGQLRLRRHPSPLRLRNGASAFSCVLTFVVLASSSFAERAAADQTELIVGSKRFTESYILGEIVLATARAAGVQGQHKQGMGNTGILF